MESNRGGKIEKLFFDSLCQDNKDLLIVKGYLSSIGRKASWLERLSDELYELINQFEPVPWSFRIHTHKCTADELVEDECDYEEEEDEEYCESCAEKAVDRKRINEPDNKHTIIGEMCATSEVPMFNHCEGCGSVFGYSYLGDKQELEYWLTIKIDFNNLNEIWEAYQILTNQDLDNMMELYYTVYQNIAKCLFEYLKQKQSQVI